MARKEDIDIGRLCATMHRDRQSLRFARTERYDAVQQYLGKHGAEGGSEKEVPVNLISLYVSVVGRNLLAKAPRVMLSTFDRAAKPSVSAMQQWCNHEIQRTNLAMTLQRVVLDAIFSVGVLKSCLATPAEAAQTAWNMQAGEPVATRVDLDDLVFDTHARDFSEVSYIGHRFRVPLKVVKESKLYGKQRKDLAASTDNPYNRDGDERISMLGRGPLGDSEEFEDLVDLWEIYLPRHRCVVTLADDFLVGNVDSDEALRYQDWIGPDCGPYLILSYGTVPGNIMPKAPMHDLIDLHEHVNGTYRKLIRQTQRFKEIDIVRGGADATGNRVIEADDGQLIFVDNPEAVGKILTGGPNREIAAMAVHFKDLFGYMAGNLDMMGGLSPQSKTLGQDQMLAQNASKAISDLQDRTVTFTSDVIKSLCWYWWHDPYKVMKVQHNIEGMPNISITRKVGPEQRRGDFADLDIRVDPYSLQHQTPQARLQALNQVVQQIVIPMTPLMQPQGQALDMNAYLRIIGEWMDMPQLGEIITIQEPPQQDMAPSTPETMGKPGETTRNYVRRSVGADTQANHEGDFMNMMNESPSTNGQQNGTY